MGSLVEDTTANASQVPFVLILFWIVLKNELKFSQAPCLNALIYLCARFSDCNKSK